MRYPSEDGFTLVELIVVLVVAGVALAIVTLSLNRAYQKSVLREEATRLQGTLRHARDTSLLMRLPVLFALDEEEDAYWLESDGQVRGNVKRLPDGVELTGTEVVFLPKGNTTGGWVTIRRADGAGFTVEVDTVTGKAEVRRL